MSHKCANSNVRVHLIKNGCPSSSTYLPFLHSPHSTITESDCRWLEKFGQFLAIATRWPYNHHHVWQVAQLDSHASNYFLWIAALRVHRFSNFGSINPENYDVLTRVLLRGVVVFLGECQIIQYSCHNGMYKSELRARWFYLVCDSRRRMTWTIHPWVESFFTE